MAQVPEPKGNSEVTNSSRQWIEQMYDELHAMASSYMHNEQNTVSLSPTVLIHELYLRLPAEKTQQLSRTHFFALAAVNMRRYLVDQARFRKRQKRGGAFSRKQLTDWSQISPSNEEHVLAVDDALNCLAELDQRQAAIVEMRFFGGMTVSEVAEHLSVSKRTIEADWTMAKAWLRRWFDQDEK
ncbi:MAG: sigma-70 family RNA polymerase sigma factor [Planctomycetales bacterium]|nr:sigma-70 family RNA polymerase sigma factor [Planctomycetales bacterium]